MSLLLLLLYVNSYMNLQIVCLHPAWLLEVRKTKYDRDVSVKGFQKKPTKFICHFAAVLFFLLIFTKEQEQTERAAPAHSFMISQ